MSQQGIDKTQDYYLFDQLGNSILQRNCLYMMSIQLSDNIYHQDKRISLQEQILLGNLCRYQLDMKSAWKFLLGNIYLLGKRYHHL